MNRAASVLSFAIEILHGDDAHRQWLMDAARAHIAGKPIPPVSGKGGAEVAEAKLLDARAALNTIANAFWSENEPHEDRVADLQQIAADALAKAEGRDR